jgi:excisionase family DNA binding protein
VAERWFTIEEAAQYLNISKTTLRRWTKVGTLPCSRIGAKAERRFLQKDLDACVSRETPAAKPPSAPVVVVDSTDPLAVLAEAASRGVPRHVCLHYRDANDLWRLFRPYVLEQLRLRQPILYIHEEGTREAFMSQVRAEGYDPDELIKAGLLRLLSPTDGYLRASTFVPERMVDFMEAAILAFRAAGHERVLISGEMSWHLKGTPGTDRMIEYEALLNELLARHPQVTIVCHYDTHRLDGEVTLGALCSHTHVQLHDRLVPGYFSQA